MNETLTLGKKDSRFKFYSKWPIFISDITDKKGIYNKLQLKLRFFELHDISEKISNSDVRDYFLNYPEIDFETIFFKNLMPDHLIFKIKNKIYSYTVGVKSKRKIYIRFYFDYEKILSID